MLGPFGGAMVTTMVPEVGAGIGVSNALAAQALTWYMVPFAGFMLVSGTLGERWGRARIVRWACVGYAVASLVCVLADDYSLFMLGRALQGTANAFTTPLLLALISDLVPPEQESRAVGQYVAFQAAGQAFSPVVGGAFAGWHYEGAFAAVAAVALLVGGLTPMVADSPRTVPARWRALANSHLIRTCVVAMCNNLAYTGVSLLTALLVSERFGLSPQARGLVVATFGVAGLLAGRAAGDAARRLGLVRVGRISLLLTAVAMAAIGVAPHVLVVVALMASLGATVAGVRVTTHSLALGSTPTNKAGAMSLTLSAQFSGAAISPLVLLPLYGVQHAWAFLLAGFIVLSAIPFVAAGPGGATRASPTTR